MRWCLLFPFLALAPPGSAPAAHAAELPSIESVIPLRDGDLLATLVHTRHLPGEQIASSLESGLPSAIELRLDLRNADNQTVAENQLFYRLAFDLWEEIFRVEGPGTMQSFESLESLQQFLDRLPRMPVTAFGGLDVAMRHRLRVGCRLHPVAPRETERLGEWVGGEPNAAERERNSNATNEREASVSLKEIIGFFYRGATREEEAAERFSAWFVPDELPESSPSDPEGRVGE